MLSEMIQVLTEHTFALTQKISRSRTQDLSVEYCQFTGWWGKGKGSIDETLVQGIEFL